MRTTALSYGPAELDLVARLNTARMRAERRLWTRRLVLVSIAAWIQVFRPWLPLLAWLTGLALAGCASLVVVHAVLEARCARDVDPATRAPDLVVHGRRRLWPDVAGGCWSALGAAALVPMTALLMQWRVPPTLTLDLAPSLLSVLASAIGAELLHGDA